MGLIIQLSELPLSATKNPVSGENILKSFGKKEPKWTESKKFPEIRKFPENWYLSSYVITSLQIYPNSHRAHNTKLSLAQAIESYIEINCVQQISLHDFRTLEIQSNCFFQDKFWPRQ